MAVTKRARDAKSKEQRRDAILQAASTLYKKDNSQLPTIAQIASSIDLAKGTIYLYFKTKEAIFLSLYEDHYELWLKDVSASFESKKTLDQIPQALRRYVESETEFFTLASISSSIIESNIDSKHLLQHKNRLAVAVKETAAKIAQQFEKDVMECKTMLIRSYATMLGLWQVSHPSKEIERVLQNPNLQFLKPDFSQEADIMLQQIWQPFFESPKKEKASLLGNLFGSKR